MIDKVYQKMAKVSLVNLLKAKYRYFKYRSILLENGALPINSDHAGNHAGDHAGDDAFSDTTEEDTPIKEPIKKSIKKSTKEPIKEQKSTNGMTVLENSTLKGEGRPDNTHFSFHGTPFLTEDMKVNKIPWPEMDFDKAVRIVLEFNNFTTKYQKIEPSPKVIQILYDEFVIWFKRGILNDEDKPSWTKHIRFGDYISRKTFETIFHDKEKYEELLKNGEYNDNKDNKNNNDNKDKKDKKDDDKPAIDHVTEYENKILDIKKQIANPDIYFLNPFDILPYDHKFCPGILYMSFDKDSHATFADVFDYTNPFDTVQDWPEIGYDDAQNAVNKFKEWRFKGEAFPLWCLDAIKETEYLVDHPSHRHNITMLYNENAFKSLFFDFVHYYNTTFRNENPEYPQNGLHMETFKKIIQEQMK